MALKSFGEIFNEAFAAYKKHFSLFIKVSFILYFIPTLILGGTYVWFALTNPQNTMMIELLDNLNGIISAIFTMLLTFTVIKILLVKRTKEELSVGEALKEGSQHFGEGIVLSIIMGFALIFLYLLFIIPGIIFSIYWTFAFYALITDKVGFKKAMSHSKQVVKGRWWTVAWYSFLQGLIVGLVSMIVLLPVYVVTVVMGVFAKNLYLIGGVTLIITAIVQMLVLPFSLTFMEKFYLSLKENTPSVESTAELEQSTVKKAPEPVEVKAEEPSETK